MGRINQADLAKLLDDVPSTLKWDIVQMALDLAGIVNPAADAASAFISLVRGDLLGFSVGVASILPIGDVAKVAKFGKYRKAMTELVTLAVRNPKLAKAIRPAMRQIEEVLNSISGFMGKQDDSVMATLFRDLDGIRAALRRYNRHMVKLSKVERYGAEKMARRLGRSGKQYVGHQGVRMSVNNVVDAVTNATKAGTKAVKDEAKQLLDILSMSDGWIVTAGKHTSKTDATTHITVMVKDVQGQFHLRLDKRGHLFQITHGKKGKPLSNIKRW